MLTHWKNTLQALDSVIPWAKKEHSFTDVTYRGFLDAIAIYILDFTHKNRSYPEDPMLLHTPRRGRFSEKLSHFWAPEKRESKRRKANHYVLFVSPFKAPVCALWGPNTSERYWIYNTTLTGCTISVLETQIAGVHTKNCSWQRQQRATKQAAKSSQDSGAIFYAFQLGLRLV